MAYKLKSQDLKDATAGTTSAAIKAGGEERRVKKAKLKGIRGEMSELRRSTKGMDLSKAIEGKDQMAIDKITKAKEREQKLLKQKADIKDWSTRKRINVGARRDVNIMDKPIQAISKEGKPLYESGYDSSRATVSGIKSGSKAAEMQGTGGLRYQNIFSAKGEYMYSDVATQPGEAERIPRETPPPTSPPDKTKKKRHKPQGHKSTGRYKAQKAYKGKGKRTKGYVATSGKAKKGLFKGFFQRRGANV